MRGSSDHNDSGANSLPNCDSAGLHAEDGSNPASPIHRQSGKCSCDGQTSVIQKVQKTVEVPQIQFIDKFADAPASVQTEGKKRKLPVPTEGKTLFVNTASGDEEEDEGETHAPVHFSLCDSDELETRSKGENEKATTRQVDDILLEMKDVKSELLHVRELIGVLVRKERCSETKAEIAARKLDRLEREQDEQDDKESETNLEEALSDKTKVVKLVIDKWFVDKGFGFGKVSTGEAVFIHASVVHGGEVLMVGTDAWVQIVNDEARAEGGCRVRNAWGPWKEEKDREKANRVAQQVRRAAALTAELAAQSERKVAVVCDHPPGLRDEPAEHITAPNMGQVAHTPRPK